MSGLWRNWKFFYSCDKEDLGLMGDEALRELERKAKNGAALIDITAYVNALFRIGKVFEALVFLFTDCLHLDPAEFESLKERGSDEVYRQAGIDPEMMKMMGETYAYAQSYSHRWN